MKKTNKIFLISSILIIAFIVFTACDDLIKTSKTYTIKWEITGDPPIQASNVKYSVYSLTEEYVNVTLNRVDIPWEVTATVTLKPDTSANIWISVGNIPNWNNVYNAKIYVNDKEVLSTNSILGSIGPSFCKLENK